MLTARRPPVGKADAQPILDYLAVEQPPALSPAPLSSRRQSDQSLARVPCAHAQLRCRIEPYLDQGGAATRRRWPGVSAAAQPPKARAAHAGPGHETPPDQHSSSVTQAGYAPGPLIRGLQQPTAAPEHPTPLTLDLRCHVGRAAQAGTRQSFSAGESEKWEGLSYMRALLQSRFSGLCPCCRSA